MAGNTVMPNPTFTKPGTTRRSAGQFDKAEAEARKKEFQVRLKLYLEWKPFREEPGK
ncbi:MAG TPA: hypothetical protein VGX76_25430 [Pirellulales bacterium]|nr:hypothetical protein [Pirellulales bacterium]